MLYQQQPIEYLTSRLGVPRATVDWESLPEYATHKWDGTPNPLMAILNGLAASKWVGVESGVGCGKTFLAACIALWFFESFRNSIVVTTAPKEKQLELQIWKEIGILQRRIGLGFLSSLKLRMIEASDEWLIYGEVSGVKAEESDRSATKAQGKHAEHMLIITEETPGISSAIMKALQNTCTSPHNLILALGNPDHAKDTLHEFCTLENVVHVTISGFDHPNVVTKNPHFIPGAQSEVGLANLAKIYKSETNPLYISRAKGISPLQSVHSLIRLEWCYAARDRGWIKDEHGNKVRILEKFLEGPRAMGVDVANSEAGDKAAIAYGKGCVLEYIEDFQCPDSNQLGERVHVMRLDLDIEAERIGVDGIGVGAGTVNKLKELGDNVLNINAGDKPVEVYEEEIKQEERYANLRAQMWWQARLDLEAGLLCLPPDEELFADLVTPRWFPRNGKITVEKKEEIIRRLGHSPNKGDAFVHWNWVRNQRVGIGVATGDAQDETAPAGTRTEDDTYKTERRRSW